MKQYLKISIIFRKKKKQNKLDLCIDFIKKNNFVDKMIFGIHNIYHLKKIIDSNIQKKITYPIKLVSNKKNIIDPRKWHSKNMNQGKS